ncbi:MAG TPA: GntR family transcriptional regulator [Pseudothermotoga sp.]
MEVYQKPPKVSESIAQQLKQEIIKGFYKPGERMKIMDLAKRFGVSQTSVREALKILEKSDLVTEFPRRGYIVTKIDLRELLDIWKIKEKLWSLAISWFVERANEEQIQRAKQYLRKFRDAYIGHDIDKAFEANFEFTDVILEGCGSKKLVSLLESIEDQAKRYRYLSLEYDDNLKVSSQYFMEIAYALGERNSQKASELIASYIQFSASIIKQYYEDMMKCKEKSRKHEIM